MEDREFTTESFYKFVGERKLMGARCRKCGNLMVPPRPVCPKCYSRDMEWVELSGKGIVESFTIIHVPTVLLKGREPYTVAVVKLDEGPRIPGIVVGVQDPNRIKIGDRVEVDFEEAGELPPGITWPTWPRYIFVRSSHG